MDLRQIRQFVVLAEELNFRRAAQRLHMSQPPLSAAIRRLEKALDATLLERNRRAVRLTPAGELFLAEARRILAAVDHAKLLVQSTQEGSKGVLRAASIPSALVRLLPIAMRELRRKYPGLLVEMARDTSRRQVEHVAEQKIDVGVVIPAAESDPALVFQPLYRERLLLACAQDHELARLKTVTVEQIGSTPLVSVLSIDNAPGYASTLIRLFHEAGLRPNSAESHSQWENNLVMASAGYGVTILPEPLGAFRIGGLSLVPIVDKHGKPVEYPVALVMRKDNANPAVARFIEEMHQAVGAAGMAPPRRPRGAAA